MNGGVVKWSQAIHGMEEGTQALSPPENGNLRDFGEPLVPWEQPQTAMLWQRIICVRGVEREVESKWSKEHACGTFVIIFDHHS